MFQFSKTALVCFIVFAIFQSPETLFANDGFHPVSVGEGPLLFFFRPESSTGKPSSNPADRVDVLFVFDPQSNEPPQRVWSGNDPPFVNPIAMLSESIIVFEEGGNGGLLDLSTGKETLLKNSSKEIEVISVEHGKVYFLEMQKPQGSSGYKLKKGDNDSTVIEDYFRPDNILRVLDPKNSPESAKLAELQIEQVLFEDDDRFIVVSAGQDGRNRNLCSVKKSGGAETICPFPDFWVASLTRIEFSPNRKRVAVTAAHEKNDFHESRELMVVDLHKKKVVSKASKLKPLPMIFCSVPPSLFLNWADNDLLYAMSADEFAIDLNTGKPPTKEREREVVAAVKNEEHQSEGARESIGFFEVVHGQAFYKGDKKPVADVLDASGAKVRDLAVDCNGKWLAFASSDSALCLVDGEKKKKRTLMQGWTYDIQWLPKQMSRYRE